MLRHEAGIEGMHRELDERICLALLETAVVALAHGLRQGLEGGAHGRSTDRVQLAADQQRPIVPDGELEPAFLDGNALIPLDPFWIECVAQPDAVVPEAPGG
jgi:hypothetical protein